MFCSPKQSGEYKYSLVLAETIPQHIMVNFPEHMVISYKQAEQRALNDIDNHPLTGKCPRPLPNSYWATPLLLATEYPYAPSLKTQKLDYLLLSGVRTFVDLTEHGELSPYAPSLDKRAERLGIDVNTVEYHCFPIQDRSLPQSVEYMCQILDVLRDNENRGRITAVHCRGGIGRTGMVVGCWLVECGVAQDGDEALAVIAREWKTVEKCRRYPYSPETGPQFEFVKNFQRVTMKCDAILSKRAAHCSDKFVSLKDLGLMATFLGVLCVTLWVNL